MKAITGTNESGNTVNIKIRTSDDNLAMAQEDVPLRELNSPNREAKSAQVQ
jgi:hypothetical protein